MSNMFSKKTTTRKKATKKKAAPPKLSGFPSTEYATRIGANPGDIKTQVIQVKEPARVTVIVPNGVSSRDIVTQLVNITDIVRFK